MNKYFIWFKLKDSIPADKKSQISASIHNYIFTDGIKFAKKSNAFFFKSSLEVSELTDKIVDLAGRKSSYIYLLLNQATTTVDYQKINGTFRLRISNGSFLIKFII